jgi:RHS repeat-associated protein
MSNCDPSASRQSGNNALTQFSNPLTFSSEVFDSPLGLQYYNYRHLNLLDGRWVNRDPVGENGGIGVYVVCVNSVINSTDLMGWVEVYRMGPSTCEAGEWRVPSKKIDTYIYTYTYPELLDPITKQPKNLIYEPYIPSDFLPEKMTLQNRVVWYKCYKCCEGAVPQITFPDGEKVSRQVKKKSRMYPFMEQWVYETTTYEWTCLTGGG